MGLIARLGTGSPIPIFRVKVALILAGIQWGKNNARQYTIREEIAPLSSVGLLGNAHCLGLLNSIADLPIYLGNYRLVVTCCRHLSVRPESGSANLLMLHLALRTSSGLSGWAGPADVWDVDFDSRK